MKHKIIFASLTFALLLIALASSQTITSAQSGGTYDMSWNVIGGGGDMSSTGGPFSLDGTIGQSDADGMSGGNYSLAGGFWGAWWLNQISNSTNIYLPFITK